ncbi:MAG: hypothetical protein ACI8PZ_002862 [Myxococcota bacterium]|jgi:hypothetical protein
MRPTVLFSAALLTACGGGDPAESGDGPPSLTLLLTGEVAGLLEPCG